MNKRSDYYNDRNYSTINFDRIMSNVHSKYDTSYYNNYDNNLIYKNDLAKEDDSDYYDNDGYLKASQRSVIGVYSNNYTNTDNTGYNDFSNGINTNRDMMDSRNTMFIDEFGTDDDLYDNEGQMIRNQRMNGQMNSGQMNTSPMNGSTVPMNGGQMGGVPMMNDSVMGYYDYYYGTNANMDDTLANEQEDDELNGRCNGIVYTVRKGDSLYNISRRFNVPLDLLLDFNPVTDVYNLQIGMKLCVPVLVQNDGRTGQMRETPMQGTPMQGTPMQGSPMQGSPMQGTPMQGTPMQGAPMQGSPMQGTPMQGTPMQGSPMQGTPMQGTPGQGTPTGGTTNQGSQMQRTPN